MPHNNAIAQQELSKVYDRINSVESKVDETNGYLRGVVESNVNLIDLLKRRDTTTNRIITALVFLLLFAIGVIAYGAIGERGLKTVRDTLPTMPTQTYALPAHNDFDKWGQSTAQKPHKK
jgi:hypothetical protein